MTSPEPCVDCGTDSVATCQRCNQRKCGAHYILAASLMLDGSLNVQQASGRVIAPYGLASLPREVRLAFAVGGPGCTSCRQAASDRALAGVADDIEVLLLRLEREPTPADLGEFRRRAKDNLLDSPAKQLERVIAGLPSIIGSFARQALTQAPTTHELLTVQLSRPGTFRKRIDVHVLTREPVVYFQGERASGLVKPHWAASGSGVLYSEISAEPDDRRYLVPAGYTPEFDFSSPMSVNGSESEGGYRPSSLINSRPVLTMAQLNGPKHPAPWTPYAPAWESLDDFVQHLL